MSRKLNDSDYIILEARRFIEHHTGIKHGFFDDVINNLVGDYVKTKRANKVLTLKLKKLKKQAKKVRYNDDTE